MVTKLLGYVEINPSWMNDTYCTVRNFTLCPILASSISQVARIDGRKTGFQSVISSKLAIMGCFHIS